MQCFLALRSGPEPSGATLPVPVSHSVTGLGSCVQRGGSQPWELQFYEAVRQLGQELGRPKVAGKEGAALGGPGRGPAQGVLPSLHLRIIQKGLCLRYSQQGRDLGGGSSTLPGFVCKENRLWLGGCPLSPSLGKT